MLISKKVLRVLACVLRCLLSGIVGGGRGKCRLLFKESKMHNIDQNKIVSMNINMDPNPVMKLNMRDTRQTLDKDVDKA